MKAEEIEKLLVQQLFIWDEPEKSCEWAIGGIKPAVAEIEAVVKARMEKAAERIREYQSQNNQLLQELAAKEAELATMREELIEASDELQRCLIHSLSVEAEHRHIRRAFENIGNALAASTKTKVLWSGEALIAHYPHRQPQTDFHDVNLQFHFWIRGEVIGKDGQQVKVTVTAEDK